MRKGLRENHKGTSLRRQARTTSRGAGWSASKMSAGLCSPGLPAMAIAVKTPTIRTASGGTSMFGYRWRFPSDHSAVIRL